jgi:SAM-dependent methyltransferase
MEAMSIVAQSEGRPCSNGAQIDELRIRLRGMWSAVAGSWAEHAGYVDARCAPLTQRMLDLSTPQPGERVLELACGPGGVGLAAAHRIGPDGEVVMSDAVARMTEIAAARAAAMGLTNVTPRTLDLERIEQPDDSYDVVLCREGLMFAVDPARAASEIERVMRPGGRVAVSVWGPRDHNPWLGVVFDAVSEQLGRPLPAPGAPGPFSLGDSTRLAGLLADAGVADVAVEELPTPLCAASFDEWWGRTSALAGPLATILASMPEAAMHSLRARLREAVRAYETADGLEFPGVALLATGRGAGAGGST